MDPIVCGTCSTRFAVGSLTENDFRALFDQHYYEEFAEELRALLKVQGYYRRHPEAEGHIKSHLARLLQSDDPQVQESRWAGVPFDQIELPPEELPVEWTESEEDREVVNYLRHNDFAFAARMKFVSEKVAELQGSVRFVPCLHCQMGQLRVPPEDWDTFTAGDEITWYWPEWHGLADDGTLHVKTTGWQGGSHWTGETAINPNQPDYDFWRWFVTQKQYHRLVETTEMPTIQEEWKRQTKT